MVEHHRIDSGGVGLHVEVFGSPDAPPLVLLHGWPEDGRCWRSVVPRLESTFRLVVPDQRGFGRSAMPPGVESYTMAALLGDLLAVLDRLGIRRAGIVGHDTGGALAWSAGAFAPERITRMVVLASPHPLALRRAAIADPQQMVRAFYVWLMHAGAAGEALLAAGGFERLASWAFSGSRIDAALVAEYRAMWAELGRFHAMAHWYRANYRPELFNPDLEVRLPPVTVPTRYLHGGDDMAFVPGAATGSGEFVAAEFREDVIAGAGHWLTHDHPERVAETIAEWMRPERSA